MLGAGDDERKINYDWPCDVKILNSYYPELQLKITKSAIKSILKKIVEWIGRVQICYNLGFKIQKIMKQNIAPFIQTLRRKQLFMIQNC